MPPLILLALLVGAVLYLAGALLFLYRYLTRKATYPNLPRLWFDYRRRSLWLALLFLLCLAAFVVAALWNSPLPAGQWLSALFGGGSASEQMRAGNQRPLDTVARQTITQPEPTTSTTTTTTSTTSTTASTSTSSSTTSTTLPQRRRRSDIKGWTVCAASFRDPAVAQLYAQRLRKQGLQAQVTRVDLGPKGVWNRVCLGTFPTLAQARSMARSWEKQCLIMAPFLLPLR